ncbi:hypothetical protein Mapa_016102 [Marchantia paleacea]|nr:hypothetical protein Mapa_016102 [Marchantia paleacea]
MAGSTKSECRASRNRRSIKIDCRPLVQSVAKEEKDGNSCRTSCGKASLVCRNNTCKGNDPVSTSLVYISKIGLSAITNREDNKGATSAQLAKNAAGAVSSIDNKPTPPHEIGKDVCLLDSGYTYMPQSCTFDHGILAKFPH